MALVNCPNCNQQISDQAKRCVHCGTELNRIIPTICPECGTKIIEGQSICSVCGYPIEPVFKEENGFDDNTINEGSVPSEEENLTMDSEEDNENAAE